MADATVTTDGLPLYSDFPTCGAHCRARPPLFASDLCSQYQGVRGNILRCRLLLLDDALSLLRGRHPSTGKTPWEEHATAAVTQHGLALSLRIRVVSARYGAARRDLSALCRNTCRREPDYSRLSRLWRNVRQCCDQPSPPTASQTLLQPKTLLRLPKLATRHIGRIAFRTNYSPASSSSVSSTGIFFSINPISWISSETLMI